MKVMIGWSGELASGVWRKFDVELDETDLHRILADWDLDLEPKRMKSVHVFQVLNNQAEMYLAAKLAVYEIPGAEEKVQELAKSREQIKERISGIQGTGSA